MKPTFRILTFVSLFFVSSGLWAQYGFGTNTPNANAAVEITSPDKGVLLPRIALTDSTVFLPNATATDDHTSMLIFNTSSSTLNGLLGAGYYYWTTTTAPAGYWTRVSNGPSLSDTANVNETLRWDGSNWVSSGALLNDDMDITATGSMTIGGNLYTDSFSTVYTSTPSPSYELDDVVLHEGRFYRVVDATNAATTTPDGTNNAAVWEPISSAPQFLSFEDIGAGTATSTTATLTISESNSLTLLGSDGIEFNTAGTTNTLTFKATNDFNGTVSTSGVSETLTLTLANDTTGEDVFDLSSFEEVKAASGLPTAQTFDPPAASGDLFLDTDTNILYAYNGTDWAPVESAVENIYTDDGSLTATRTVNLDGNWLKMVDGADVLLYTDPATDRIYIGSDTDFTGTASYTASVGAGNENLDLVVEGDLKSRFIVDENNEVGNTGDVLTKTATGVQWKPGGSVIIETITASAGISDGTTILLIQPAADTTVTMPTAGSGAFPEGYTLKIRRNQDYTGTNDSVTLSGSIDGAGSKLLNVGYQSLTVVATSSGWLTID